MVSLLNLLEAQLRRFITGNKPINITLFTSIYLVVVQVFSLSVWEMGTLLTLGLTDSCEFFHDPFKGRSDEGKVRKVLKVEPTPDGNGRFFNLSVQNRLLNVDENIYIPITKGEYAVIVSTFNYIIPHIMGWSTFTNSIKPEESQPYNRPQSSPELEWRR